MSDKCAYCFIICQPYIEVHLDFASEGYSHYAHKKCVSNFLSEAAYGQIVAYSENCICNKHVDGSMPYATFREYNARNGSQKIARHFHVKCLRNFITEVDYEYLKNPTKHRLDRMPSLSDPEPLQEAPLKNKMYNSAKYYIVGTDLSTSSATTVTYRIGSNTI